MDMVNDGKDIRLDTPQAVKEALASGKDLYNPQTGDRRSSSSPASPPRPDARSR